MTKLEGTDLLQYTKYSTINCTAVCEKNLKVSMARTGFELGKFSYWYKSGCKMILNSRKVCCKGNEHAM